jgi:stage V sporulation protein T
MKATGIVRRIDDLGRIVIPKEIRRTIRVKEGDPLEIYVDREGSIILKKYNEFINYIDDINSIIADVKDSYSPEDERRIKICDVLNNAIEVINKNL